MDTSLPFSLKEIVRLSNLGIDASLFKQGVLTMESDKYICIKQTSAVSLGFKIIISFLGRSPLSRYHRYGTKLQHRKKANECLSCNDASKKQYYRFESEERTIFKLDTGKYLNQNTWTRKFYFLK